MRLVFPTSSAKALSRNTTWVSPAGDNCLCHFTIPKDKDSASSLLICGARQVSKVPAPMLWTVLPEMIFCSMGIVRSRPSLSNSSNKMSCSVRSVFRCSKASKMDWERSSRLGSQALMLEESSLKTRKPRSPAKIGFSALILEAALVR